MAESTNTDVSHLAAEIADNPEWRSAVRQANDWVRETLGRWAESKFIQWRLAPTGDRVAFDLRVTDGDQSVSCRFDVFEVGNEYLVKRVVLDAWGTLIDQVLHAEVEDLKRMRDEWKKEAAVAAQD